MKLRAFILISVIISSCKSSQGIPVATNEIMFVSSSIPRLPILVYKTKKNYNNLVPVLLNDDKTQIVSYPDPKDLKVGGSLLLPTLLENNYLLDNKGIGKNVAFLKYTYEEYSKFQTLPTLQELYNNLIDLNPLIELCDCGNKSNYEDLEKQLNEYLRKDIITVKCKVLK